MGSSPTADNGATFPRTTARGEARDERARHAGEPAGSLVEAGGGNSSKRRTLWGLAAIAAFALSYLQLALVPWYSADSTQRVNNGNEPTFFAFHIEPYGVTSEDFHLYAVRAKRILDRGWTDSPLTTQLETGSNYAAPLQVLLGMVAVQTDGRPLPYSIFMACVLLFGWSTLFLAARRFLPEHVPTSTILLSVMIAVLFEAVRYVLEKSPISEGRPWPTHCHMRMSTLSWTTPLLLSAILAVTSLPFQRRFGSQALVCTGVILCALTGVDNWAFGLAWMVTALSLAWLTITQLQLRLRGQEGVAGGWRTLAALVVVLVVSYGLNRLWNRGITGDVMLRCGLGPDWRHLRQDSNPVFAILMNWFLPLGAFTLVLIALAPLVGSIHVKPVAAFTWLVRLSAGPASRWRFALVGCTSALAMVSLMLMLAKGGMEPYLRYQLYWRIDLILLFALTLTFLELLRGGLARLAGRWPKFTPSWGRVAVVAIIVLFGYHQYRLHWFAKKTMGREYFLTADAERLRPWLEEYDRTHKEAYTLATLSPELNYLCAYWTNADLAFPSGFPYHNLNTNENIHASAVDLLRLYQASPQTFVAFTDPKPIHFNDRWRVSRVEAAGLSFIYHLYHRTFMLDTDAQPNWHGQEIQAIARELNGPPQRPRLQPDLVLIDDVSRALGQPDLSAYELAFKSGAIEVWRRQTAAASSRL